MISYLLEPNNAIGAVRPSKLVKYLSGEYCVDVITGNQNHTRQTVFCKRYIRSLWELDNKVADVLEMGRTSTAYRRIFCGETSKQTCANTKPVNVPAKKRRFSVIRRGLTQAYFYLNDWQYAREGKKLVKEKLAQHDYDVVISTFGPMSSHIIAAEYKKTHPSCIWIADFRDPAILQTIPRVVVPYLDYWTKQVQKRADAITAVSEGVISGLHLSADLKRKYCIPNGFDPEDQQEIDRNKPNGQLTMVYTGALYEGRRSFLPVFDALYELIEEKKVDANKVCLSYAGKDFAYFYKQGAQYQLEGCMKNHGVVSRQEAQKLQAGADVLLLASWNTQAEKGVISGKFYEYLFTHKPILCCISGDVPNSQLHEYITDHKLGFCYEEATDKRKELKAYLYDLYCQFEETGFVKDQSDHGFIEQFSYKTIANRYKQLIEELANK